MCIKMIRIACNCAIRRYPISNTAIAFGQRKAPIGLTLRTKLHRDIQYLNSKSTYTNAGSQHKRLDRC